MIKNNLNHSSGPIVGQVAQVIAALTAIAITLPVLMYAYGYSTTLLEQFFSFAASDILAKTLLGTATLIMIFFARPRSKALRTFLAVISSAVLAYAVFGAASQTLALGDTIIYLVGTFIGMSETFEARLPERTIQPAHQLHQTPTAKL